MRRPNMRVQRTRRLASLGRSLRSLGSPLTRRLLGTRKALPALCLVAALLPAGALRAAEGSATNLAEASAQYEAKHPEVKRVGGSVTAPVLLTRADPAFSEELKKKNREQSPIILEVVISETGDVIDPVVLSTANPDLHPYALEAIQRWKYRPAREKEKAVPVFITVSILLHGPRA